MAIRVLSTMSTWSTERTVGRMGLCVAALFHMMSVFAQMSDPWKCSGSHFLEWPTSLGEARKGVVKSIRTFEIRVDDFDTSSSVPLSENISDKILRLETVNGVNKFVEEAELELDTAAEVATFLSEHRCKYLTTYDIGEEVHLQLYLVHSVIAARYGIRDDLIFGLLGSSARPLFEAVLAREDFGGGDSWQCKTTLDVGQNGLHVSGVTTSTSNQTHVPAKAPPFVQRTHFDLDLTKTGECE